MLKYKIKASNKYNIYVLENFYFLILFKIPKTLNIFEIQKLDNIKA